ncbi:uncharacterized protein F4807DRAFT_28433 [Annulohypoxylon truncatum]|uniref:uncharacterized protein n=1 Tax=Annulohypoxylon truncatum TaxID=327061 RepID=UPI0020077E76|nr:uncharacterized protein F4807DRAFT_28433 [Annulohypoxylon truncatum]KAI1211196.1 hypothetical protein F4807DRAFT_28433 [Annulohypoxylon truncatum]
MFLHSGASLHGHEYSSRPAPQPGHRRNPLLRSAFAKPINRTSSYRNSTEIPPAETNPLDDSLPIRRPRPLSEQIPKVTQQVVRFQEPKCDPPTPAKREAMSEDEGSIASDSDASRVSSSPRRTRRRVPRKSTTFLFAHPPPKLRNKQLLIHIRPKLLLQIQQLSANQRPRPIIDVYPSSAVAGFLIAPLLKRFPLIARIKRELGGQDIMLVKSEDYAQASGSESEDDEDDIKSRELLAILSPSRTEDKAEIVQADGTVWIATPRLSGTSSCSYDFVSVDSNGNTITARWVRKQVTTKSLPATPTTARGSTPPPPSVDYKFTFSIIDPNCRRHPIMATLTNSSLDILDTYTTVSQSASRYPPTSPLLSTPISSSTSEESYLERTTRKVEDWQKTFITISAIWVILRHGSSPNYKPADLGTSTPVPPSDTSGVARKRSLSVNTDAAPKVTFAEVSSRRKFPGASLKSDQFVPGVLPRRATSIGAPFMPKRCATDTNPGPASTKPEQGSKNRRPFSGDWSGQANRNVDNSLAAVLDAPLTSSPTEMSAQSSAQTLTPAAPLSKKRRAVSACYSVDAKPFNTGNVEVIEASDSKRNSFFQGPLQDGQKDGQEHKAKNQKLRSLTNWFRKLQGR